MGKKATYPEPEKSLEAIKHLTGDRKRPKELDLDFFMFPALVLCAIGGMKKEPAFILTACFILLSSWINQKPNTPFLSNSKVSLIISIIMAFIMYSMKLSGRIE